MDLTVIIPSRRRPARLAACIARLARQDLDPARFEVLVGIDGEDDTESGPAALAAAAETHHLRLEVHVLPRRGLAAARNALLARARGTILLSMNDDVLAEPGLCRVHAQAGLERLRHAAPATIVGDTPWVVHEPDRLFDLVVRQTSLIFFYDQMGGRGTSPATEFAAAPPPGKGPDHDWGFRHAFGLNVSYPTALVREVGGYAVFPETYGFEDLEIAWRLADRFRLPVLFRPEALGLHDHRMEPADYLERERKLGAAAWGFAHHAPACARATFGRDITAPDEVAYARAFVEREAKAAERLRQTFLDLGHLPVNAIAPGERSRLVKLLYEQHLLLKRWCWRRGLVEAAG